MLVAGWLGVRWSESTPVTRSAADSPMSVESIQMRSNAGGATIGKGQRLHAALDSARCLFPVLKWSKAVMPAKAKALSLAQSRVEATAVLLPQTLKPLAGWQAGQHVLLPLDEGEVVEAVVKLAVPNDAGWVRVGGAFVGVHRGEFSLAQKIDEPLQWAGHVYHHERQVGYELKSTATGLQFNRKPLDSMVCQGMPRAPGPPPAPAAAAAATVMAAPPALDSKPDAVGVLYLDFDGEVVTDPGWNGGATILAQPALMGGYPITNAQITEVWQRVAEDFTSFDVTVTTIRARYDAAPVGARVLCIVTPTDSWYYYAVGGVAKFKGYRGPAAGHSSTVPCWVFNNSNASVMALTCSHELGHMLDLMHDGTTSLAYYGGHDSGVTSWGPIMGAPWYHEVTQWSIGDYPNANNQEDDFEVVAGVIAEPFGGSGYVADEAGGTIATAAELEILGTVNRSGVISSESDADYYLLRTEGGALNITGRPAAVDPNLDVELTLYNAAGTLIMTSAVQSNSLSGNVTATLAAGDYYLAVRGKGRVANSLDSPPVLGYSRYGSAGAYTLTGSYVPLPRLPLFTQQPTALTTVNYGTKVTLSVKTLSHSKVSYQWQKDGVNLPGKTAASLVLTSAQAADAGTYVAVATNAVGEEFSDPAVVVVLYKPIFTVHPLPAKSTVASGSDATFTVNAHGTAPITWQWRKNGVNLPGETGDTLTLTSVDWFDAGSYTVVATNGMGFTASSAAVLTVTTPPLFTTQPPALKPVASGGSASVALSVVGTAPISYQWFKDGAPIPKATTPAFSWSKAAASIEGTYFLKATNPHGVTDSQPMLVAVQDKPVITLHPQAAATLHAGDAFSLQCAATGTETLVYQWQLNGVNVPGGSGATLTINPVNWLHRGTYRCVVSNAVGSVVSKNAVITVVSPPIIITPPSDTKIANRGTGVLRVVAGGTPLLKYQWMKDGNDIPKATGTSLTLAKASPASTPGSYAVRVSSNLLPAGVTSAAATVVVEDAPQITLHPVAVYAPVNGSATFTVAASGSPTLTYQWQSNNINLPGETSDTLTLTHLQLTQSASLRAVVSNDVGKATSTAVKLTVQTPPTITRQPVNQIVYAYDNVTFSVAATGTATLKYQWFRDTEALPGQVSSTLKLTRIQEAQAGIYTVKVTNLVGSVTSADAVLTVNPVPPPTIDDFAPWQGPVAAKVFLTGTNLNWTTKVMFNGKPAGFVIIRPTELLLTIPAGTTSGPIEVTTLGGEAYSSVSFDVLPGTTTPNDYLVNAIVMSGKAPYLGADHASATREFGEYYYGYGRTLWFRWRAPVSGIYGFNTQGSSFDTHLFVYTGPVIPQLPTYLTLIDEDDNSGISNGASACVINVTKGTDYFISVDQSRYSYYYLSSNSLLSIYPTYAWSPVATERFDSSQRVAKSALAEKSGWQVQGTAAGVSPATDAVGQGFAAYVGGASRDSKATVAWLRTDNVAKGSVVSASVDLSVETMIGTPELFSWTLYDPQGDPAFALSFDAASGAILSQIADEEAKPTGQIFEPGARYELNLEADYSRGTWAAAINGAWIIENQPLPTTAIENGFGDVGAVWVPAPGSMRGGKMHFDNLKIETRSSLR